MLYLAFASLLAALISPAAAKFWMEEIPHRGISPFNPDKSYLVFRNVKDFGAKGDGVTDDTDAINAAIAVGDRCGGGIACQGTTTTPAVVYFPKGTYLVSSSIVSYYYTQMVGDPTSLPVIKATKDFKQKGLGLIESNPYQHGGGLKYQSTNTFFRQIRNFVLDLRQVPGEICAIHWPSSQATSIQNVHFMMTYGSGSRHTGIFIEEGSGGVLNDLVFYGGKYGAQFGNQQYTARNFVFHGSQTAILQIWDWGWTYKSMSINNCKIGINMTGDHVGSVTLLDSDFNHVDVAIATGRDPALQALPGLGSLVMENVDFEDVGTVLKGPKGTIIKGSPDESVLKRGFGHGNLYAPYGPYVYQASDTAYFPVPPTLTTGSRYYERSKPQYESTPVSSFLSARTFGAKGDGVTDDTEALNRLLKEASKRFGEGAVAFLDAGYYRVTDTVFFPSNLRVVGEALSSVILAAGPKFSNIDRPHPVVQVGKPGDRGYLEWSDCFVSTQGPSAGAVLIEYNLATHAGDKCKLTAESSPPSGIWDVHTRIGGFAGSKLQVAECPKTPKKLNHINDACIAAYMSCHITRAATGLYMENTWFWVADHDIDSPDNTQIAVFAGRGLLIESERGRIWLVGTAVEHHVMYQYQLVNTRDIWMGQIQTESAYYQPNPPAPWPFTNLNKTLHDPDFAFDCEVMTSGGSATAKSDTTEASMVETKPILTFANLPGSPPCEMGWGLRIIGSKNVVIYGAGLYSFFNNWSTACCKEGYKTSEDELGKCQARIFYVGPDLADPRSLEPDGGIKRGAVDVSLYNLNTVGVVSMINHQGNDVAFWKHNAAGFTDTVALFKFQDDFGTSASSRMKEDIFGNFTRGMTGSGRRPDEAGAREPDSASAGSVNGDYDCKDAAPSAPGLSWGGSGASGFTPTDGEAGYLCFGDWQQLCGKPPQVAESHGVFMPRSPGPSVSSSSSPSPAFTSSRLASWSTRPVPTSGGGELPTAYGPEASLDASESGSRLSAITTTITPTSCGCETETSTVFDWITLTTEPPGAHMAAALSTSSLTISSKTDSHPFREETSPFTYWPHQASARSSATSSSTRKTDTVTTSWGTVIWAEPALKTRTTPPEAEVPLFTLSTDTES